MAAFGNDRHFLRQQLEQLRGIDGLDEVMIEAGFVTRLNVAAPCRSR